jgi:hypothetical protein
MWQPRRGSGLGFAVRGSRVAVIASSAFRLITLPRAGGTRCGARGEDALAASSCDPHLGAFARARRRTSADVAYLPKPWRPLNVLMVAEQALAYAQQGDLS